MNLKHETSFIVMPYDCNYMKGPTGQAMIHGGSLMGYMDRAAAVCVSRLLHDSECDSAITTKGGNLAFHAAAECGDIIYIETEVIELRTRAIKVQVKCYREKHGDPKRDFIAETWFVFVSRKSVGSYPEGMKPILYPHGLSMPKTVSGHMIVDPQPNLTCPPRMVSESCPPGFVSKPDWRKSIDAAKISSVSLGSEEPHSGQAVS